MHPRMPGSASLLLHAELFNEHTVRRAVLEQGRIQRVARKLCLVVQVIVARDVDERLAVRGPVELGNQPFRQRGRKSFRPEHELDGGRRQQCGVAASSPG